MEDLAQRLQTVLPDVPPDLSDLVARPESFREPPTGAPPNWQPEETQLKLYQPVHGHFYLIAASLVCRIAGMPDRFVNTAQGEKASFVLRRITLGQGNEHIEMAWVNDPQQGKGWLALTPDVTGEFKTVAKFEELLPMFPVNFTENERRRRLLVGLIPTSSRESFQAAPSLSPITPDNDPDLQKERQQLDPRLGEANTRVIDALNHFRDPVVTMSSTDAQEISRYILLDLADTLSTHLPTLWQAIKDNIRPTQGDLAALFQLFIDRSIDRTSPTKTSWLAGLQAVAHEIDQGNYDATNITYNLKQTDMEGGTPGTSGDTLYKLLKAAFAAIPPPTTPPAGVPTPASVPVPKLEARPGTKYVLRCVYRRPHCGPLHPDIVSNATNEFVLAPFFDFDAPTRPIRISMPVDTSIAGLRKFKKNVAFIISDKLRQQMECLGSNAKGALQGELGCDQEFNLGAICSFSIPIITICALIVLFIFLILLNIVFWWLPFIRICFPISLKAKR